MKYISSAKAAAKWGISERSVRNYCSSGRVEGAFLTGKTWNIPYDADKPISLKKQTEKTVTLKDILMREKNAALSGGIYHRVQIELTFNSNHIEGSRLSHDQTRYIYETNTIGLSENGTVNVDDIVETVNHFRCIDTIIETADKKLSEAYIKELHRTLKSGTSDSRKSWFAVGEYKKQPNEVGGEETVAPRDVHKHMAALISEYENKSDKTLADILDFHARFEKIHPFQDGNGRVGRLIMFKECLRYDIVPFIIDESIKLLYYNGLKKWNESHGYLTGTCELAQDAFKGLLDYFEIRY